MGNFLKKGSPNPSKTLNKDNNAFVLFSLFDVLKNLQKGPRDEKYIRTNGTYL